VRSRPNWKRRKRIRAGKGQTVKKTASQSPVSRKKTTKADSPGSGSRSCARISAGISRTSPYEYSHSLPSIGMLKNAGPFDGGVLTEKTNPNSSVALSKKPSNRTRIPRRSTKKAKTGIFSSKHLFNKSNAASCDIWFMAADSLRSFEADVESRSISFSTTLFAERIRRESFPPPSRSIQHRSTASPQSET
jgi:hypothetical protein